MTTVAIATPSLLDAYQAGAFFFAGPRGALLARGTRSRADGFRAGALPFDTDGRPSLVMPETVRWGPSGAPAAQRPQPYQVRPMPEPYQYTDGVRRALGLFDEGLRKVVLARALDLTAARPIDPARILGGLAAANPGAYVFGAPLPGGRTLVGASPELLVARRGDRVTSHPLAGSAARSPDPVEDERRGRSLRASAKDLREHAVVVEAVADGLGPYCAELTVPSRPSLVRTPAMWHLGTKITGRLRDRDATALDLARALHPTPAVCGTPVERARRAIAEIEPFDRGYYAGAAGWCDARGDGEWAVAIRCAEIDGDRMRLYAGAGIVPGSDPEAELAETSAKFQTMLRSI